MSKPPVPLVQDMILASVVQGESMKPLTPSEEQQIMGQIYYLVKDDTCIKQLNEDAELKVLIPALSHMIRTSNLEKKTVKMMKLRFRRALRLQLMVKKTPNLVSQAKFDAWCNYGMAAIEDAIAGWRGKLVTERIKTYKIETTKQKRRFGLF